MFDFDVYNAAGPDEDFHLAIKQLHEPRRARGLLDAAQGRTLGADPGRGHPQGLRRPRAFLEPRADGAAQQRPADAAVPIFLDPPDHTTYRALINPWFSPKAVAALEPKAASSRSSLIDELKPRGRCDFVTDFAQHLPIQVFMSIVDVPAERPRGPARTGPTAWCGPEKPEDVHETIKKIFAYASQKIAERRANPGDDLISKLTQAEVNGRPMTHEELMGMVSLILIGGMDTVVSAMSFAANFLAGSPRHRQQLIERPELIPKAVDELLRRFPVVNQGRWLRRTSNEGRADESRRHGHHADDAARARRPQVRHRWKWTSIGPTPIHSTFGNGPHRCPGSNLGRTELKIFLQEWLPRIPDFRHDPNGKVGMSSGVNATVYRLPLVWDVA